MPTPLAALLAERLAQLGINAHELAARLGYTNTNKGSRRLQSLMAGNLTERVEILSRLPAVLGIDPEEIAGALRAMEAAKQRDLRLSFVPHAVIVTERTVPSQITFCALTRGVAALLVSLDVAKPKASYVRQALTKIDRRTEGGRKDLPFFGSVQGFVVNYEWGRAIRFDRFGRALELMPRAARIGTCTWSTR